MNIESWVAFGLILGVLVFFHEWGHFIAAKLSGIRVEEFAFGFGPRLVRLLKRGDTEYTIHAVPLGGFVKLAGMEPGEEDIPDGLQAQSAGKRAAVFFAGPFFSFILAVLVFQFIGIYWGFQDESKTLNKVLMVNPHTVASRIGLRAGDTIIEIDGKKITNGTEMVDAIHSSPGKQVTLFVERNGSLSVRTAVPRWSIVYLDTSWSFMDGDRAIAGRVDPTSSAQKAGIQADDELVSINGKPILDGAVMEKAIRTNGTGTVTMQLLRKKQAVTVRAKPTEQWVDFAGAKWYFPGAVAYKLDKQNKNIKIGDQLLSINGKKIKTGEQIMSAAQGKAKVDVEIERGQNPKHVRLSVAPGRVDSSVYEAIGLLGFTPQFAFIKMGFVKSIEAGWAQTTSLVKMIFASLSPSKIGKNVGGPILIAKQTSMTVALGPYYVVQLAGMLSMSLAVINLFPIPLFDGGHLALLGVEAIRKRRLTKEQMGWFQMVGFAIIILLIVTVFYSDISKLLSGQIPQ